MLRQVVLVDHELRFTPALQTARQLLRDGAIGEARTPAAGPVHPSLL